MTGWDVQAVGGGANVTWKVEAPTPLDALRQALEDAMSTSIAGRRVPPMPSRVDVTLTVREDGSREGLPVAVLTAVDVTGDSRQWHLSPDVLMELVGDLAVANRQLHRGEKEMPAPWRSGGCAPSARERREARRAVEHGDT